jgi:hypothetical protein
MMPQRLATVFVAVVVLLAALIPLPARAEPSEADKATARQLVMTAYEALERKDFATAADRFERANALFGAPTILLGLGRARLGLAKLIGAQDAFSRAANTPITADTSDAFKKAIADAQRELQAMMPRVPSVVIDVRGAPSAKVTLDDVEVPAAALGVPRAADPGRHVIRAHAPGFANGEAIVTLTEGRSEKVVIDLKPGESSEHPTPALVAPPPGTFTPSATTAPSPTVEGTRGGPMKTVAYSAIGVGAAGLVVGGITGGLAISKHSSFTSECGGTDQCSSSLQAKYQSDANSYYTLASVSTVAFIAGGAVAATGLVLLLTAPSSSSSSASVTPTFGLGYLGMQGRF